MKDIVIMNKIIGKICIVLVLCIPLFIGLGIIVFGIIFQLEINLVGSIIAMIMLSFFSISTFLYKKEILKELKS